MMMAVSSMPRSSITSSDDTCEVTTKLALSDQKNCRCMFSHPSLELRGQGSNVYLFAVAPIEKDALLFSFISKGLDHQTRWTVQVSDTKHVGLEWGGEAWQFTAHDCEGNSTFLISQLTEEYWQVDMITTRRIKRDEPITYNWLISEWDMVSHVICTCQSPYCFREIRGMRYVNDPEKIEFLEPQLFPYMQEMLRRKFADVMQ
eukprot:TRINITY_DN1692_c0_g1_i1.p1 TRINITY_DN1692_c0_g1~~TRINITY_DN1692_c0_g1_i1.p1  ORF type:complete len:203 (-),score=17.00 TRINITY_DN1692_c0_g1_i1:73-681(-)